MNELDILTAKEVEQIAYYEKLCSMKVSAEAGLAILAMVPHVPPSAGDELPDGIRAS